MFGKKYLDCCGGEGRHLDGCTPTVRRNAKHDELVAEFEANKTRQKREAKRNLIGRRMKVRPYEAEVAQGCHVEKDARGYYYITEDKDQGKYGRTA